MRFVEGEGGSIDEAIARALEALGATRDQVEIDILENALPGLLGFGRRRARVRATVRAPLVSWQDAASTASVAAPDAMAPPSGGAAAVVRGPRGAAIETRAGRDGFEATDVLAEVLRHMGWRAGVMASAGDPQTLEIAIGDPTVRTACDDEVLRAFAFVLNRIAERHGRDGRRFAVTLGAGAGGTATPRPAGRGAERPRSNPRGRRGGGRPRR